MRGFSAGGNGGNTAVRDNRPVLRHAPRLEHRRHHQRVLGCLRPGFYVTHPGGLDLTGKAAVLKGVGWVSVAVPCFPFPSVARRLGRGFEATAFRLSPLEYP